MAFRFRGGVEPSWPLKCANRDWWPVLAERPYGDGSTKMRFDPGTTVAGFFPAIPNLEKEPAGFSTFTKEFGTNSH